MASADAPSSSLTGVPGDGRRQGCRLDRPRVLLWSAGVLTGELILFLLLVAGTHGAFVALDRPTTTDFVSFYAAGALAATGTPWLAYDAAAHYAAEQAATAPGIGYQFFFYPPMSLLWLRPLSRLPYLVAFSGFVGVTLAAYLPVMRAILRERGAAWLLPVLAFPAVFWTAGLGQNAFLTAALFGAATLLLERRPILSGLCFAALCYKPHFGLLVPFALLAGGHWRVFFVAACGVALWVGLSLAVFSLATWQAYLAAFAGAWTVFESGRIDLAGLVTPFGAATLAGLPSGLAYWLQLLSAGIAGSVVLTIWWRRSSLPVRAAALVAGTLLSVPVALLYDLMLLTIGMAWLVRAGRQDGFRPAEPHVLAALYLVPLLSRAVATATGIGIGPLAPAALLALCWVRARDEWRLAALPPVGGRVIACRRVRERNVMPAKAGIHDLIAITSNSRGWRACARHDDRATAPMCDYPPVGAAADDAHAAGAAVALSQWFRRQAARTARGIRLLRDDRRGAIALAFAVGAVAFLAMAGAATELGAWYLLRRQAQNAADAAALAGSLAVAAGQNPVAAATDLATRNDFTSGTQGRTVIVNYPYGGRIGDVEVIASQRQQPLLAGLFLSGDVTIGARSLSRLGWLCGLSLSGDLVLLNSQPVNCRFASNALDAAAISITYPGSVQAFSLQSAGGCSGCSGIFYFTSQPATIDPFAALGSLAPPSTPCVTLTPGQSPVPGTRICGGTVKAVASGTYYLSNDTSGHAVLSSANCTNCNFALFGSAVIDPSASLKIQAPPSNPADPMGGVAIYQASGGSVTINGASVIGALYFPNAALELDYANTCSVAVARSLTLNRYTLEPSSCAAYGIAPPQPQARLVSR